jgi:hypothetical protein
LVFRISNFEGVFSVWVVFTYESRVCVVLPGNPVRDDKVGGGGDEEKGKVLVMGVEEKGVNGLGGERESE